MLHSCTPSTNKERILLSFESITGTIRLLIATIAFGMRVDCNGVYRMIHYGPSRNVEAYIQETGRAGRDGIQSAVYILYHGILLSHVDGHMRKFVKTRNCRRKELLKHFDWFGYQHDVPHLCCDKCAVLCHCGLQDCKVFATYTVQHSQSPSYFSVQQRQVNAEEKKGFRTILFSITSH